MTAIEFYRLTEEMLKKLAKAYFIDDITKYYELTDERTLEKMESKIKFNDLDEIGKVFAQIAFHGQNAQRIDKIVDFKKNFDFLCEITVNFNPEEFLKKYGIFTDFNKKDDESFKQKVAKIVDALRFNDETEKGLKWKSKVESKEKDMIAKRFAGILLCAAIYLKNFKTREDVLNDLIRYYEGENKNAKLINHFREKIYVGFTVPLSCDFLKEFDERFVLPKPDVHLKDTMARYSNEQYRDTEKDNYRCIQDTINLVKEINEELIKEGKKGITVYQFDRMVYLVCSQNFFLEAEEKTKGIKTIYLDKIK